MEVDPSLLSPFMSIGYEMLAYTANKIAQAYCRFC